MAEKTSKSQTESVERPPLKKHDIKMLDLAFAMDCTGSMGSYIDSARDNIRQIVEEIVASEKSEVQLALVEYRDHPPEDTSFVTRVHDFTSSPKTMKEWLSTSEADGGGDTPEAVADALQDVLKLSWRQEATKICVCISDSPPHGINACGDAFANRCPAGIDPMDVTNRMAEKGITLYMVGCEPSITPYKDFFMAIAFITGGQYVPLTKAQLLTQVIVGGAQEEMSLEQFMDDINAEAEVDLAAGREIDEEEFTRRVHSKMVSKGIKTKQLQRNKAELSSVYENPDAMALAGLTNLSDVREKFKPKEGEGMIMLRHVPVKYEICTGVRYDDCAPVMDACYAAPPPMAMAAPSAPHFAPPSAPPSAHETEDTYETVEAEISYAQSSRMVQKFLKRNVRK